jgi:hypothetical protein
LVDETGIPEENYRTAMGFVYNNTKKKMEISPSSESIYQ